MSFELNKEQKDIQKGSREFVEREFRNVARDLDADETFDDKLWKKAAELGFGESSWGKNRMGWAWDFLSSA